MQAACTCELERCKLTLHEHKNTGKYIIRATSDVCFLALQMLLDIQEFPVVQIVRCLRSPAPGGGGGGGWLMYNLCRP